MVTTRSHGQSQGKGTKKVSAPNTGEKRSHDQASRTISTKPEKRPRKKDENEAQQKSATKTEAAEHEGVKQVRSVTVDGPEKAPKIENKKVEKLLQQYVDLPLSKTDLDEPGKATPDTLLAMLLHAILSSTRVSHAIAAKTTDLVIKAGYHKLDVLKQSTWDERTEVLTSGGYTHYREKTATFMGELADILEEKYEGDLNTILKKASEDPKKIRAELKTIKGLGDIGIDIFFTIAQHVWPCLGPWIDPRSLGTAEKIGLGDEVQALWKIVGQEPEAMCRLACALTDVRLERKESEWA